MAGKKNKLNSSSKRSTFIDGNDSDSDSSSVSFLAVPEQFRPKSPIPKKSISELKLIENKVSNNPTVSKPLSYSGQPEKIPMQKNSAPGNIKESSMEHEKSNSSGKSHRSETTLFINGKKSPKETERLEVETTRCGNHSILEVTDEPIRCRNTKRTLKMSETADKPRAPIQDMYQNNQKWRNTSVPSLEVVETASEANEKKIIGNGEKDDRISLSISNISVIDIDLANIPSVNEKKRDSKNKLIYEILPGKTDQNCSANTKRNPVTSKFKKKNRRSQQKQLSFTIQKQKCIRWNSDLNLNVLSPYLHSSIHETTDKMCQKSSDNKIEWTVVHEEKTSVYAKEIGNGNLNNCRQKRNEKTNSKVLFDVKAKSSTGEANIPFTPNRREGSEPKIIPKASKRQNALNNDGKKTQHTRNAFYRNNLKDKRKNVLMFIQASNTNDCRNSEGFEKSSNEIEYDCCKKYTTRNEDELSEENHCCLCEISKSSNEINRVNGGPTHGQLTNVNLREENQRHQNLISNKDSFPRARKANSIGMRVSDINGCEKCECLGESCRKTECDICEQDVPSDDVISNDSLHNKKEVLKSSKNANVSCQQLKCDQPKNVNLLQENARQQNLDIDNHDSFCQKEKPKDVKSGISEPSEENKNPVLQFGREISDLVIGCHISLSIFFSTYNEWNRLRRGLIEQFEQLEENIRDSSKKYAKYSDLLKVVDAGATAASAIPHPCASIAARIVPIITSLIAGFINTSKSSATDVEEPEIIPSLFQDIDLSSELYMHGLQCNMQFEETTKFIEEFLSNTTFREFCASEDSAMSNFIRGVLEYTPKHRIFYKKLHKCFQELIQKCSSFSRRFCEPFELYQSDAVDVIGYLDWRFTQDFNNESVRHELEEITRLIQSKSTSMEDLLLEIRKCIRILKDEVSHLEKCVSKVSMFDSSLENFKLNSK